MSQTTKKWFNGTMGQTHVVDSNGTWCIFLQSAFQIIKFLNGKHSLM